MRPKSLILLLLALGCGLVASIGISQVMENRRGSDAPAVEMEPIFVAMKDISNNEPMTPQNVKLEPWPKTKIPADAIKELKELEGKRAGTRILAGEPIRAAKFDQDERKIPSGYRVVAVPADAVSSAGQLMQPGDRVDVLVYVNKNASLGITQSGTKTILHDVQVFAVNEQWRPTDDKAGEVIAAKTISLLVTPPQAELVTLAAEMGRIRLTLRNPDDEQVATTEGTDADDLFGSNERSNRNAEFNNDDKKDNTSGLLSWLNGQSDKGTTPPTKDNASPQPVVEADPIEHFVMELLKGEELSRVEFSKKQKDKRWSNDSAPAAGSSMNNSNLPPMVMPSLSPTTTEPTNQPAATDASDNDESATSGSDDQ